MAVRVPNLCDVCQVPERIYVESSCPGCGRVAVHDVKDVAAFVHSAMRGAGLPRLTPEERAELHARGVVVLLKEARRYQPGFGGRNPNGSSFAGYASKFLRLKLSDEWHKMHETHSLVTQGDGSRKWEYDVPAVSLQALSDGNRLDTLTDLQVSGMDLDHALDDLPTLLEDWWEDRRSQLMPQLTTYLEMRAQGYRNREIADEMRLLPEQLKTLARHAEEITARLRATVPSAA